MRNIAWVFVLLAAGCATGSRHVTGTIRPSSSPDQVVTYHTLPPKAEIIGWVTAHSFGGLTMAGAGRFALAKAKREAAKLGANGLVLDQLTQATLDGARVRGEAVFVPP